MSAHQPRPPQHRRPTTSWPRSTPSSAPVATSLSGPLCVLAGAGTGKTRAITHRIAYGVHGGSYQPQQVLAVTFTARAAGEMRAPAARARRRGVQARTFHSAALRQLQYFWPQAIGGAATAGAPHKVRLVAEAGPGFRFQLDRTTLRDLASEVEWAKVSKLTPENYPAAARRAGRDPAGADPTPWRGFYAPYSRSSGRGVIDFEDVLLLTVGVLQDRPISPRLRRQYRHFVVDETRTSARSSSACSTSGGRAGTTFCVVGDASRPSTPSPAPPASLLGFARAPAGRRCRARAQHRSTPQVVGLANGVLRRPGQAAGPPRASVAGWQPGPIPTYTGYADDPAEAAGRAGGSASRSTRACRPARSPSCSR